MSAVILDGLATAANVRQDLAGRIEKLSFSNVTPGLGSILVGDDGASATYVGAKHKACAEVGIQAIHRHLPQDATQADVLATIREMNDNPDVDGILLQLPLPKGLDEEQALLAIDPVKDVDGLHPVNLGKLVMSAPGPLPCTPAGIVHLLEAYDVPLAGKHVVVVGRGLTIGRPLSLLMAMKTPGTNSAVTVVHTGVPNLADYTRQADILVAAAGFPGLITKDMVKAGAAVVGAGVTREGKKILSDVADDVEEIAGWMSPRLGGVGPMTIAMLLQNTVLRAEKRAAQA